MSTQQYCRVGKVISGIETETELHEDSMLLSNMPDLNNQSEETY